MNWVLFLTWVFLMIGAFLFAVGLLLFVVRGIFGFSPIDQQYGLGKLEARRMRRKGLRHGFAYLCIGGAFLYGWYYLGILNKPDIAPSPIAEIPTETAQLQSPQAEEKIEPIQISEIVAPTDIPEPTNIPTEIPTDLPTAMPTDVPTDIPPTAIPTETMSPEEVLLSLKETEEALLLLVTPTPTDVPPTDTPEPTPTLMPTATPTLVPTATHTPIPPTATPEYRFARIANAPWQLNLRDEPDGIVLTLMQEGDLVEILDGMEQEGDYFWREIKTAGGTVGWVAEIYLDYGD